MTSHVGQQEWIAYLNGALPAAVREEMELHMAECDACLTEYLLQVEAMSDRLPLPADEPALTRRIVAAAVGLGEERSKKAATAKSRRREPNRQAIWHYAIAAGITMLLMTSGVFQQIAAHAAEAASLASEKRGEPISAQLLQKTVAMLDALHPDGKGGLPE